MDTQQETQQEKETRWATERAARDTQQLNYHAAPARTRRRNWLVVGAGAKCIVAVIFAAMLL